MTGSDLERFRRIVLAEVSLQEELRGCLDRAEFVALVIERAQERGCSLETAELTAAFEATARNWVTRGAER